MAREGVLILTQCFPPAVGGIETLMAGMAEALAQRADVRVFADAPAAASSAAAQYEVLPFGGLKFLRRRRKARAAAALLANGGRWRVFCDSWKSLEFFVPPPGASVAPVVVFAHGSEFPQAPTPRKRRRIAAAMAKAGRALAVSSATAQLAARFCAAPPQVWRPPLRQPPQPTEAERQRAAALWGEGAPRVLTVARLAARKGVDTALRAVALLQSQRPKARYIIAGAGEEEPRLRQLAKALNLQNAVCFAGKTSGGLNAALYQSADVFLLTGRQDKNDVEGYGLVFDEAGYWGLPAVAAATGGAAEAVTAGTTGLHCQSNSPQSAADALLAFFADDALRARLRAGAQQQARQNLWQKRVGELL